MAMYCFLLRLYHYSDSRIDYVEGYLSRKGQADLNQKHLTWYEDFEKGFCVKPKHTLPMNAHCFLHLLRSRRHSGPLWRTSTEPFEAIYAVMRRCYKVGTPNTSKQAMQNYYVRDV